MQTLTPINIGGGVFNDTRFFITSMSSYNNALDGMVPAMREPIKNLEKNEANSQRKTSKETRPCQF